MTMQSMIIPCPHCGAKNRLPQDRQTDHPRCGKCHQPLRTDSSLSKPVDVTDLSFNDQVINHPGLVLVDFWAPWCGPCKMMGPILEQLAREYAGRVKIAKLNVDENHMTAALYSVSSIPALLIFKHGRHVDTLIGAMPKMEVEQHLMARM